MPSSHPTGISGMCEARDASSPRCVRAGPTLAPWLSMTTLSDSNRLVRVDDAEDLDTALRLARRASSSQDDLQGRSAGVQASGTIVFSSLFIMAGLGVGGAFGLHAYVHRNDPPLSVDALPPASTVLQPDILPPRVSSAALTAAPSADAPAAAPPEPISRAVSKASRPPAVAATDNKSAPSKSASDNPY